MNFPFEISRQKPLREHQQMYIMYEIFILICENLPHDDFPAPFRESPGLSELLSGINTYWKHQKLPNHTETESQGSSAATASPGEHSCSTTQPNHLGIFIYAWPNTLAMEKDTGPFLACLCWEGTVFVCLYDLFFFFSSRGIAKRSLIHSTLKTKRNAFSPFHLPSPFPMTQHCVFCSF